MDRRPGRRWPRLVLVLAVVCAVPVQGATTNLGASTAAAADPGATCRSPATHGCVRTALTRIASPAATADRGTLRELQLNLCNSGQASCYAQDRSPGEAAGLVDGYAPTVVTLNEICSRDVLDPKAPIRAAMAMAARRDGDATVFALFTPALAEASGLPYHCVNGDLYGIGIVGRGPAPQGPPERFVYRHQHSGRGGEGRVALCTTVGRGYDVCTTHLESDHVTIAASECRELMAESGDVDRFRRATGDRPTMVAGDLNLGPAVAGCVPVGWREQGDRGVQHVLWTDDLRFTATQRVPLHDTDHPALLVDLAVPAG